MFTIHHPVAAAAIKVWEKKKGIEGISVPRVNGEWLPSGVMQCTRRIDDMVDDAGEPPGARPFHAGVWSVKVAGAEEEADIMRTLLPARADPNPILVDLI